MKSLILISIALSVLSTLLGAIFKIQSWEGGGVFLLIGTVILPAITIALAIYTA